MTPRLLAAALAASVLTTPAPLASAAPPERPNVLFIAVDDLKPAIGVFGDPMAVTPNIDALAARGTVFLNAHCQQAVCAPSRVSLLTGLRPDTTEVWDLKTEMRAALPDVVTLPQAFKNAGYASVGMGKIFDPRSAGGRKSMDAISWSEPFVHVNAPADETYSYRDPAVIARIEQVRASTEMPRGYNKQLELIFPEGKPSVDAADVSDETYFDGAMTEVAKERLSGFADSGESFFLAVGFKKPHLPFNAPQIYWDLHDRAAFPLPSVTTAPEGAPDFATQPGWELRSNYDAPAEGPISEDQQRELIHGYYAATSYIDAQVGELMETLDAEGLADNTIVVLWGDHGWHLGDHAMWCKHTNYEQATRSPLLFVVPGIDAPPATNASPVEFVDVYPTLLDLAGIPLDESHGHSGDLHGTSLRPILTSSADRVKDVAVSQYPRGGGKNVFMGYAYRTDRHRLVRWRAREHRNQHPVGGAVESVELYDYQEDPLETRNLAADPAYADVLADLHEIADRHHDSLIADAPAVAPSP